MKARKNHHSAPGVLNLLDIPPLLRKNYYTLDGAVSVEVTATGCNLETNYDCSSNRSSTTLTLYLDKSYRDLYPESNDARSIKVVINNVESSSPQIQKILENLPRMDSPPNPGANPGAEKSAITMYLNLYITRFANIPTTPILYTSFLYGPELKIIKIERASEKEETTPDSFLKSKEEKKKSLRSSKRTLDDDTTLDRYFPKREEKEALSDIRRGNTTRGYTTLDNFLRQSDGPR